MSQIYACTEHGDPFVCRAASQILTQSAKPFLDVMTKWIYDGILDDPFEEFFVAEQEEYEEDNMWRGKYTLRNAMIPGFISNDVAHRVHSLILLVMTVTDIFDWQNAGLYSVRMQRKVAVIPSSPAHSARHNYQLSQS